MSVSLVSTLIWDIQVSKFSSQVVDLSCFMGGIYTGIFSLTRSILLHLPYLHSLVRCSWMWWTSRSSGCALFAYSVLLVPSTCIWPHPPFPSSWRDSFYGYIVLQTTKPANSTLLFVLQFWWSVHPARPLQYLDY